MQAMRSMMFMSLAALLVLPATHALDLEFDNMSRPESEPERTIFDFAGPEAARDWQPVDDRVMGGSSQSRLAPALGGGAIFTGLVSMERGGGFASVRSRAANHDLSDATAIRLRVKGDGRRYRLNLRQDDRLDGIAYQASFRTENETWQTIDLPLTDFVPVHRGRVMTALPPLDPSRIKTFGLLIGDHQQGAFTLQISWIKAVRKEE